MEIKLQQMYKDECITEGKKNISESIPWLYKIRTFDFIYPFAAKRYYSILVVAMLLH
jgi:hypothetical protein